MWGAVIGDLAGSIYEFGQIKEITEIKVERLLDKNCFFSDDTILTIAILDAILNDKNYDYYLKKYARDYANYQPDFKPYFRSPFSPGFTKWVNGNYVGKSCGNGAMMRISSVGYLFNTEEEIRENVILATEPSHNSSEAIYCATIVALIIYYARKGMSKENIIQKLNLEVNFKPFNSFNSTCYDTIDNCLYALFKTDSFVNALTEVISYGGDTDTNACIVGAMAEALYGINEELIELARKKIPSLFTQKLDTGYTRIKKII